MTQFLHCDVTIPQGTSPVLLDEGNRRIEYDVTQQLVPGEYHTVSTYTTILLSNICFQKRWFVGLSREKVYYSCHDMPISTIFWLYRACQFYLWRKQEYQESPTSLIQMLCRVHLARCDDINYCLINDSIDICQYHTIPSEKRRLHKFQTENSFCSNTHQPNGIKLLVLVLLFLHSPIRRSGSTCTLMFLKNNHNVK